MVVKFSRPIEASYAPVVKGLGKYLSDAKPGADGRSVTFTLKDDFGVRSFDMGAAVIIDLLDKEQAAPTSVSAAPKDAPPVNIRAAEHKDYTRIVFDWPSAPPYAVRRNGGDVVISFTRPGRVDLKALKTKPPKFILGASSEAKDAGPSVTLKIAETSEIRHSLSGAKVVVDVMPPGTLNPAAAPKPDTAAPASASADNAAASETKAPEAAASEVKTQSASTAAPPAKAGKPQALTPPPTPEAAEKATAEAATKPATGGAVPAAKVTVAPVQGEGEGEGDVIAVRFDWDEPVAAAVFRRADNLWVVFDKQTKVDAATLRTSAGNIFHGIEQIPSERATVLRINTVAGVNPGLKRDGLAWIFEFRKRPLQARQPIEVKAQHDSPVGARLFIPVAEPGNAVVVKDPEVGDAIVVVPVIPLGYGVFQAYEYPQARILMSSQGVAIQPKIDELRILPLRQGIEVTGAGGMYLSPVTASSAADATLGAMQPLTRALDLEKWSKDGPDKFTAVRQSLQKATSPESNPKSESARLDLARFFFANGYAAETIGIMDLLEKEKPDIINNPEFRVLRGASRYLMGRYPEAKTDLEDLSLVGNDEGTFWLSAVKAGEGDLAGAASGLRSTGAIIQPYPKALKMPLSMLVAEAAIEVGDVKQADRFLKAIETEKPTPAQQGQMNYLAGRLLELNGEFDGAVGKWEESQGSPHRPSRAKAAVSRAELLLKTEKITRAEAIKELEKLRFAWRGDDFEFKLLRRLGHLYMEENDFRNGLRTLRQLVTNFRKHEKAPEVAQEMVDAFHRLYIGGEADRMLPVTAIALYDEFKELTPAGAKGDEMVQKLAERLVNVDLLDRGAELLKAQVNFRLKDKEKARVGAKLAMVHILERKFDDAIKVLDDVDMPGLDPEMVDQRRHIRAHALVGLERRDEAVELLKEDKSIEADLLRTDIFWNDKNWPKAAQSIRQLAKAFDARPNTPLDEKQSTYILNEAIALALSNNERGLDRLRIDYITAMDATPLKDAFRLIASPQTIGLIDYETIAAKVTDVKNFQTFMATYLERMKSKTIGGG
ncbi:MAG: hypothetical protein A3G18_12290 [Rhodospirillales bacterium RIFCSPLOWO2_12_FULL_58_28]|nr:MAG: hypothetical protein A3H92_12305 [Rhodospirillales bacterium RIFCSPLOWO2_02_FULL_58_16]OHC79640.1 MAG: hypothetical protein A3G18_12290 [Rhodospirillales bacterium RIFCSPLOWO2_12_FULL_58_28]